MQCARVSRLVDEVPLHYHRFAYGLAEDGPPNCKDIEVV